MMFRWRRAALGACLVENTACAYEWAYEKYLSAPLGHRKVADITRADIEKLQGELHRKPATANMCLALLSAMFEKSEAWGWRPQHANPCRHVERYKTNSRERVLRADEMARLGPAIASDPEGKLFLVIALTGARVSEIAGLKWGYLDLDNGVARLPDSKTGAPGRYGCNAHQRHWTRLRQAGSICPLQSVDAAIILPRDVGRVLEHRAVQVDAAGAGKRPGTAAGPDEAGPVSWSAIFEPSGKLSSD